MPASSRWQQWSPSQARAASPTPHSHRFSFAPSTGVTLSHKWAFLTSTSTALITSSGGVDANKQALSLLPTLALLGVDPLRAHWRLASAAPAILRGGVLRELDLIHELRFFLASRPDFTGVDGLAALVIGRTVAFCCKTVCISKKKKQTVILLRQSNRSAIKVRNSGEELVYKSVPSVPVLWMKNCDKCVAVTKCFSAHQGFGLVPSRFTDH